MALTRNPMLELALAEQMKQLLRKEMVIDEASEILEANLRWLVKVCSENGVEIPDRERVHRSISRLQGILEQVYDASPEVKRSFKSPEDDNTTAGMVLLHRRVI